MSAVSVQTYRAVEHVWADGILAGCATVVYHVNSAGAEAAKAGELPSAPEPEPEPGSGVRLAPEGGVVQQALRVVGDNSGTSLLVAMLASAAVGALGGYKLGGARGRSSKGARYASVEAGE